jgi:predicted PurR-regulated permease PerM
MAQAASKRATWSTRTFLVGFAFTLGLLLWVSSIFLVPLVLGLSAAVLLGDANEWLVRRLHGKRGLAALLMSIATFAVILVPLGILVVLVVQSAVPLVRSIAVAVGDNRLAELVQQLPEARWVIDRLQLGTVEDSIQRAIGTVASALGNFAASVPGRAASIFLAGTITFLALFTFFARGPKMVQLLVDATPMERRHTRRLLSAIATGIQTVFAASFITALIQAAIGYIGFRIVNVPYPLALAGIMGFCSFIFSLIPILGSGMVWGPLGAWLVISGRPIAGAFVFFWGIVVLGSVDNVVKPLYTKGKLHLPPLVVFVTLFGGIATFGPIGALLGPLLATVTAAFLQIWTTEFLDSEPLPAPVEPAERKPSLRARLRRRPPEEQPPVH